MNYAAHYARLIERASGRTLVGYQESHHVLPRCMGGTDAKENLVDLTAEEHYVAHQLLVKMYPGNGRLAHAACMMATRAGGNKAYGWLCRRNAIEVGNRFRGKPLSPEHRAKIGAQSRGKKPGLGHKHSPEAIAKMSASKLGNKHALGVVKTAETRAKLSAAFTGRPLSEECKAKLSLAMTGRRASAETRKKLSLARIGKKRSAESVEKTAAWHRGRKRPPMSAEWIAKLAAASRGNKSNLGRKLPPEQRARISAGVLAAAAAKRKAGEPWHVGRSTRACISAPVVMDAGTFASRLGLTFR